MTEKLRTLINDPSKSESVIKVLSKTVLKFVSRQTKTVSLLSDSLSADEVNELYQRKGTKKVTPRLVAELLMDEISLNPVNPNTDKFLHIVQSNTKTEIYPGSFEDLGVPRK